MIQSSYSFVADTSEYSLKQQIVAWGYDIEGFFCHNNQVLLLKATNDSPACVTSETKEKLLERGWAILTPKERLYDIEKTLNDKDCLEFGRWLDEFVDGNFNENDLIFDLPIPDELSQRIYDSIPYCVDNDSGGFFKLNTKHFIDFEKYSIIQIPQNTETLEIIELLNSSCEDIIIQPEWEEITPYTRAYDKKYSSCNPSELEGQIPMCAHIGFDKYPQNLFDEFLDSPYNQDITFLNFTDSDLKKVPLFYVLIQAANQMDYPSNDRVSFPVSYDEFFEISDYLQQRTYFEVKHNGEVLTDQTGTRDMDGHYRIPLILIDDKLYGINGLSGQVSSDRDEILNVSYESTLEESQKNLFEDDNPNRANLIYFELNEKDIEHLKLVKDVIDKMYASDDKIHKSLDVGDMEQNVVQDFFKSENQKQFNGDESKHTRYFILNNTMYEANFTIC